MAVRLDDVLARSIGSLPNQVHPRREHVVVGNGPGDHRRRSVAEDRHDPRYGFAPAAPARAALTVRGLFGSRPASDAFRAIAHGNGSPRRFRKIE